MPSKQIEIIKEDGNTFAKVKDLRTWKDNPRDVEGADYRRLIEQIKLGEHSTMLVTLDGEVLGGNTRLRAYTELKKDRAKVIVVEFVKKEGKVHAFVDGKKAERTFESVNQAKLEYAISHNDAIGKTNEEKLAELLTINAVPLDVYKVNTVVRPIESLVRDVSPDGTNPTDAGGGSQEVDTENLLGEDAHKCPRCGFEFE